jgi:hypothetical protein
MPQDGSNPIGTMMPTFDQAKPRRPQGAAWIAWSACGLTLALLAAALLIPADTPMGRAGQAPWVLWAAGNAVVGALVAARRPENPIGWLLSAMGLLTSVAAFAGQYAFYTLVTRPGSLPGGQAMLWLAGWPNNAGYFLVLFLLLLFPTGRLPSPRWRPVARLAVVGYLADVVGRAFAPGPIDEELYGPLPNPLGIEAAADLAPVALAVVTALLLPALLAAVASLLVRLRRAQGVERLQLKWFCYAAALFGAAAFVVVMFPSLGGSTVDTLMILPALLALPLAIGIAVLRYRLYDIDRLINRTLVYGLLTILLAAVYSGSVLVLGQVFGGVAGNPPSWVIAGATLAVAALFQPARRRVQQAVDLRFNRRRYNATRTIEAFSARLRDQVDLDTLSAELLAVVDQTVQPTGVSLWLRPSVPSSPSRGQANEPTPTA